MDGRYFEVRDGGVSLAVRVKPRASRSRVLGERSNELEVAVAAPPADGAANEELVRVLADHFEVPKSAVTITRGHAARSKLVWIAVVPAKLR